MGKVAVFIFSQKFGLIICVKYLTIPFSDF